MKSSSEIRKIYKENNISLDDLLTEHHNKINYKSKVLAGMDIDSINGLVRYAINKIPRGERLMHISPWIYDNIKLATKAIKKEIKNNSDYDAFNFYDDGVWYVEDNEIYLWVN